VCECECECECECVHVGMCYEKRSCVCLRDFLLTYTSHHPPYTHTHTHTHTSVQYKQGDTCVIASVIGPLPVRRSEEIVDKAVIQVTFQRLQGPGTDRDTHLQYQLKHALAACVMTSQYPQTRISFVVQVVNDDGGLLAACLNAVYLSLLDSGIACHAFMSSVSLAIGNKGNIRVDPDKAGTHTHTHMYIYIYIYIHTCTHTHVHALSLSLAICVTARRGNRV
jgi:hypothetical protein